VSVGAEGETAVLARAVDAAGGTSAWAPATARVDLSAPTVALRCEPLGGDRHRCAVDADDGTGSGVASIAWRRDGGPPQPVAAGEGFDVTAPAGLTATATDAVGRTAPAALTLAAGTAPATVPATSVGVPVRPVVAASAGLSRTFAVRGARQAGGLASLGLSRGPAGVALRLALARLRVAAGRYRIELCLGTTRVARRCRATTVTLRRSGRLPTAALSRTVTGGGKATASVTIARRSGSRWVTALRGSTTTALQ
jgi:hypothetical protein